MSLHDRIKEARINKGITQSKLGELIGVAKTTIAGYEKNREPTAAQLGKIAHVLSVDVAFLLQDEILEHRSITASPYEMEHLVKKYRALDEHGKKMIDMVITEETARIEQYIKEQSIPTKAKIISLPEPLQSASAGYGQLADDETANMVNLKFNDITRKADYIMRVSGNSMEPKFFNGQRVLVASQPAVELGEIGIFIKGGERYIKIYRGDHMESANPQYKDEPFEEYSKCIGKVLGVLKDEWIIKE